MEKQILVVDGKVMGTFKKSAQFGKLKKKELCGYNCSEKKGSKNNAAKTFLTSHSLHLLKVSRQ